jgi:hypothetical protein
MTNTLNGYTPTVGLREFVPNNDRDFTVGPELLEFRLAVQKSVKTLVRGSEHAYSAVVHFPAAMRDKVLENLQEAREHALSFAWSAESQAARERAVRYFRVFCTMLNLPEAPNRPQDMWVLQYFAVFMGLVWKKGDGVNGLAGSTVEQQLSQVCRWLDEAHGVKVREMDRMLSKVLKGLKKKNHKSQAMMYMPYVTYVFMQKYWLEQGDAQSLCWRDAQSARFLMFWRVSMTAETVSHNGSKRDKHSRNLMHENVWLLGGDQNQIRTPAWEELVSVLEKAKRMRLLAELKASVLGLKVKDVWTLFPFTKTSENFARPVTGSDMVARMTTRWLANESFLAANPSFDRKALAFFNVNGVPLHRVGIEKELKTLMLLALVREPDKGHLSPLKFYFNTHSERKGGATWAKENGVHESWIRWMGNWVSLAFLKYMFVTHGDMSAAAGLLEAALQASRQ